MCDLCGQVQPDLHTVGMLTVCRSKRYCLLYTLRNASELQIARMHAAAVESTLASTQALRKVDAA